MVHPAPIALSTLLGCAAPPLELAVPAEPVAGEVQIEITSDRPVTLARPGAPDERLEPGLVTLDTSRWADGAHSLTVTASRWGARTVRTAVLHTDNSAPSCVIDPRGLSARQGGTLAVLVRCDEPFTGTVDVLDRERTLHLLPDGTRRALVGVPIRTAPGASPMRLSVVDGLGNEATWELELDVAAVDWPFTGPLPMARRKMQVEPEAITRMREARDRVYATVSPEATWSAPFALPVLGTHTSAFGSYREYPDGTRNHHDAEDIARRRGTPIHAPAPGRVALAEEQAIHGRAVLIDHGHGVVSLYSHLDRLDVVVGQQVTTGDPLGTMGSTGRTTGPHLHWGIVVDGVPVDPMPWTTDAFLPTEHAAWTPISAVAPP